MTIASKLLTLDQIRRDIRTAIVAKGVSVPPGTAFTEYPSKIADIDGGGSTIPPDPDPPVWQRPAEWATVSPQVNQFIILAAIYVAGDNKLAFRCTADTPTYIIDWGDGTVDTATSDVTIEHEYTDFASLLPLGNDYQTIITIQGQVTIVGVVKHSGSNKPVLPYLEISVNCPSLSYINCPDGQLPAPFCQHENYIDVANFYFEHFATEHITCSVTNSNFDSAFASSLVKTITLAPGTLVNVTSMNDCFNSCSNLLKIDFTDNPLESVVSMNSTFANCTSLKSLVFPAGSLATVVDLSYAFNGCSKLKTIVFPSGSLAQTTSLEGTFSATGIETLAFPAGSLENVLTLNSTFSSCAELKSITFPPGSLVHVTDADSCFMVCPKLVTVNFPTDALSSVTTAAYMFAGCSSLPRLVFPVNSLPSLVNANAMFEETFALETLEFPAGSLAAVENAASMFSSSGLKTVEFPLGSFIPVSNASSMFNASKLETIIFAGGLGSLQDCYNMFGGCRNLHTLTLPSFNPISIGSMFINASSLQELTLDLGNNLQIMQDTFSGCTRLRSLSFTGDLSSVNSLTSTTFANCYFLSSISGLNLAASFSIENLRLGATDLNQLFNDLATVSNSEYIAIAGNPGALTCDISIATAKGWQVYT